MIELQKLVDPQPVREPQIIITGWHIVLCEPNVEIQTSIMLNVRGFESFCPAEYRPQRTNRMENGRRVMETRAKAMIPGYSFLRFDEGKWDFDGVRRVKGVREFMKIEGKPAGLHHREVDRFKALDAKEFQRHRNEMARKAEEEAARAAGKPEVEFKEGKEVRVDGPLGESWIGKMLQQRGAGRVVILRGNAKIIVPHTRVHELVPANCE
jgi:transcription antitermination factor NusG